ncbi:MAG: patatin-like phospholipase family protein [Acidobacteriia bacterium]|nr:patatin-like phospholipase family protein [Terriglobia bacterium]
MTAFCWVLDSGGAGRGAWQGGVLYELMQWARAKGCYPRIVMGASAGGYAAADVATGTHETVMKGWSHWGLEGIPPRTHELPEFRSLGGLSRFRSFLYHSIRYVMSARELTAVFDTPPETRTRLLVFTTRVRRRDGRPFSRRDSLHYFFKSSTRKLPRAWKYLPEDYIEDPVIFGSHLPSSMCNELVRPLTRVNYHNAIEASCLVPFAMGEPMRAEELLPVWRGLDPLHPNACSGDAAWEEMVSPYQFADDVGAAFLDGGFSLKMPFRVFEEDGRFNKLSESVRCEKTIVFCCDPQGRLWETSMRLASLNSWEGVRRALEEERLYILFPDHPVEAGFLSTNNSRTMRTFTRGREQAQRVLSGERFKHFVNAI